MPFKRSYKKRPFRQNRQYKKKGQMSLALKAYKMAKKNASEIDPEYKTIDLSSTANIGTTAVIAILNSCTPGDGYAQRDGRQIRIKSLQLQMNMIQNASATTDTQFRIIVFIARQPHALLPVVADLLTVTNVYSPRNLDGRKEYIILYDKVITLSQNAYEKKLVKIYKKLDMKTVFNGNSSGGFSDVETNGLYLLKFSTDNTNQPQLSYNSRVRFLDN